ncbi:hypothetical protein ASD79_16060 [Caulobacter sp. Root655]|uniref:type II secretion system F family protein n=1 Tax=Caulobacter sp. Root655 TaxID=1736578 RepID=UPI0006F9A9A2|nr:type II secretion system F family protein [Caulobacter sp. Root655]KRA57826.1 hypothetical protein ASD79_16060 [Caulobacter sp. Root655]
MAEPIREYRYTGLEASGRRVRATITAPSETAVYERLRRDGVTPIRIREVRADQTAAEGRGANLGDRETAEILINLADLLSAGADIRSALAILAARAERPAVRDVCRRLTAQIGGGEAVDQAFSKNLARGNAFVSALIAAGETSGDLPGGMRRAGELLEARVKLREQLISTLSYPMFVLVSTIAAAAVILLFVVPSLAPLAEEGEGRGPLVLATMVAVSLFLRTHLILIIGGLAAVLVALIAAARAGFLTDPIDRFLHVGPGRRIMSGLTFGGFAIALGGMLTSGAPMTDALRLAIRGVDSKLARLRLEPVAQAVRQGVSLSVALQGVAGFPGAITRLVAVGEASGALGPMLARSGKLEEAAAIRRIEMGARMLGPILIVGLGGMIGLLMGGLLSGVTELGQAALR